MTLTTCVCEEWGNYTEEEYQIFKKVLRRSVVYYEHDKDQSPVILRTDVMFMSKEILTILSVFRSYQREIRKGV